MTKRFLRVMLYKYGENVTVSAGSGRAVNTKAFIQPLRRRHRLYIGSPDDGYTLSEGTIIGSKNQDYVVMTSEDYVVGDETVYIWAILRLKNDPEEDDYDVQDR